MKHSVKFNNSALNYWLNNEISTGRLNSGALEIRVSGNFVYTKYFGKTNNGPKVTRETTFWIASMTKPIVAVAAMILIDRGQLSLADPVSKFIPRFGNAGVLYSDDKTVPLERPVTVLDLMTHTSGLTYGSMGNSLIHHKYNISKVYDFESNNQEIAERLSNIPLLHQPGTVFEYGMSTDILGRVIEVVTEQDLNIALQNLVLNPLDMTRTSFMPSDNNRAELPESNASNAFAAPLSGKQKWYSGGAGLWSTLSDYLNFACMLKTGGTFLNKQILSSNSISMMMKNHLPTDIKFGTYTENLGITAPYSVNGLGFGLGLAVRTKQVEQIPGEVGEFFWPSISGANFWVDPSKELVVVFLTHAPEYRGKHRLDLRKAVYKGLS